MINGVAVSTFLGAELLGQLADWAIGVGKGLTAKGTRREASFAGPAEFWEAVKVGDVDHGKPVRIRGTISRFGPALSHVFLPHVIGPDSRMRRGPVWTGGVWPVAMLQNQVSHLQPAGLYPMVSHDAVQVMLYPGGAPVLGAVTRLTPLRPPVMPRVPAVVGVGALNLLGSHVEIRGRARIVDPLSFAEIGFKEDEFERLRQAGRIWFIDATDDDAQIVQEAEPGEFWGGLYAAGHLEMNGNLKPNHIIDSIVSHFDRVGAKPLPTRSRGQDGAFEVYGYGMRARLAPDIPIFALHADVELNHEFGETKAQFDDVVNSVLEDIAAHADEVDAELQNPRDLDFSYSDRLEAATVLRSQAAEQIEDPVALAIRDWHRLRES